MLDAQFFVVGPLDKDATEDSEHTATVDMLVSFYRGIFYGAEVAIEILNATPRCRSLMVTLTSQILGAISYLLCHDSGNTIITHLAVARQYRSYGCGTLLLVALQKALMVHSFMKSKHACLYVQCLDPGHQDSPYAFYTSRGFTEVKTGSYREPDASGVEYLPQDLQNLVQRHGVVVLVEADALSLRWLQLPFGSLVIPKSAKTLLAPQRNRTTLNTGVAIKTDIYTMYNNMK
jgi:ribosomal protein S18 acetylase RimI-like enzyme